VLLKILAMAITLLVVVYLGCKSPRTLVPALALSVAFDISVTWFPNFKFFGTELGTVSLARIITIAIIIAATWNIWRNEDKQAKLKYLITHPLSIGILIYIALAAVSVVYSIGPGKTVIETFRLGSLFLLFLSIGILAETKQIKDVFRVVHTVGLLLVPVALYESFTLKFFWYQHLAQGQIARVNATFVDPNIFARYLVLSIVANLVLQFLSKDTKHKVIYYLCLMTLIAGLAVTLSRSGMLTLVISVVVLVLMVPKKEIVFPVGLLSVAGIGLAALRPTILERLLTFKKGFGALDSQRQYLWQASWLMIKSHPLLGVGLGGFQRTFLTYYSNLKTVPEGATLSHTTLLTIAAELGSMGLLALGLIGVCLLRVILQIRKSTTEAYIMGAGYFVWILAIFTSSQSEGRFFEDPLVWISMAMLLLLAIHNKDGVKSVEITANRV
jgi:putative inorganic carbon (hco3(-)) transporter